MNNSNTELEQYFTKARSWYEAKYLYPHTQATYMFVAAIMAVIIAYIIFKFSALDYTTEKRPIAVYTDDQVHYFREIKHIGNNSYNINQSVAEYLLTKYVTLREQYYPNELVPERWEEKLKQIRAFSSRMVFNGFTQAVDTSNQDSPILKYGLNTSRSIKVVKVAFPRSSLPYTATVYFDAIETNVNSRNVERWQANVRFSMPDMVQVFNGNYKLQFTITGYELHKLN